MDISKRSEKGFIYLWALFAVTVAGFMMAGTGQVWQTVGQREKEKELLFIGDQFRKAIMSYYNSPLTAAQEYPESLEQLLEDKRGPVPLRHLRKIYIDPMTLTDEWGLVEEEPPQQAQGQNRSQNRGQNSALNNANNNAMNNTLGGSSASTRKVVVGIYSLSNKEPRKKENFPEHFAKFTEAETYQDWQFVYTQQAGSNNNNNNTARPSQRGSTGSASSPFGTPGSGGARQGGQGASAPSSPFAPPASSQSGQNPFAQ